MDILSILKDNNISYSLSGKNVGSGWIGICCPHCGDKSFHGGFPLNGTFAYSCFKCGSHGVSETLQLLLGVTWKEVAILLDEYNGESSYRIERKQAQAVSIELPGEQPLNKKAQEYLKQRNFDPIYLEKKYQLRSTEIVGNWKYRIIIPLIYKGTIVSYTSRDYTGKQELRYKTLSVEKSIVNPKHLLHNQDFVTGDIIGVCEGPFDDIRLGDGFVSTLGTQTSEEQIRKIARYKKAYIVFDPEEEAQKRAIKLAEKISALGCGAEVVNTELDHDPGDMTEEEVKNLRKELGFY